MNNLHKPTAIILLVLALSAGLAAQVNGNLQQTEDKFILQVWGTHYERGYAQGYLMAEPIHQIFSSYMYNSVAMGDPEVYNVFLNFYLAHFNVEQKYQQEAQGIVDGMQSALSSIYYPPLQRNLMKEDILLYNCVYDLYYFANNEVGNGNLQLNCATLASWQSATQNDSLLQGNLVISRLMDWNIDANLIAYPLLTVSHPSETGEQTWVNFGYPGIMGAISGISASGKAAFLNTGNDHSYTDLNDLHPILFSIRNGIESYDPNNDGFDDAWDIETSISSKHSLSGMIVHAVSQNPVHWSVVVETNNSLGTFFRTNSTTDPIPLFHLAATNHFRVLTNPVCCTRYANIADSLAVSDEVSAKRQLRILFGAAGLENNLMAMQYTPSTGVILWSAAGINQPAYTMPMLYLNRTALVNFSTGNADEQLTPGAAMLSAYPNPASAASGIKIVSKEKSNSVLDIFNLKGQRIASVKGNGTVWNWDGRDAEGRTAGAGIYLGRLRDHSLKSAAVKLLLLP